jgi:hypothetical protein
MKKENNSPKINKKKTSSKPLGKTKNFQNKNHEIIKQKHLSNNENFLSKNQQKGKQKFYNNHYIKFAIFFILIFLVISIIYELSGVKKTYMASNLMETKISKGDIAFYVQNFDLEEGEPYVIFVENRSMIMYLDKSSQMSFRNNHYYLEANAIEGKVVFAMQYATYLMIFYLIVILGAWYFAKKVQFK